MIKFQPIKSGAVSRSLARHCSSKPLRGRVSASLKSPASCKTIQVSCIISRFHQKPFYKEIMMKDYFNQSMRALQLAGMSERTCECYTRAVR
ncbi:MAG: hypothetical protein GY857_11310 [Desulfobacula sp.]|nr:hypothetical protein [Desulfobacula sp.]